MVIFGYNFSVSDIYNNASLFLSTLFWVNTGWDGLGNFAGEIKNPKKTYPIGVIIAIILNTTSFIISIIAGLSVPIPKNRNDIWKDGYFALAYNEIKPKILKLGFWVCIVNMVGNFGLYVSAIASTSRALQVMGSNVLTNKNDFKTSSMLLINNMDKRNIRLRLIPKQFGYIWNKTHSPVFAIIFQSIIVAFLMTTTFDTLVQISVSLNCITLIFEFLSFIRLRYTEPNTLRPYKIPGGFCIAWLITIVKMILVSFLIIISMYQDIFVFWIIIIFNIFVLILYLIEKKYGLPFGIGLTNQFEHDN